MAEAGAACGVAVAEDSERPLREGECGLDRPGTGAEGPRDSAPLWRRLAPWIAVGVGYAGLLLAVYHRVWWLRGPEQRFFGWDCTRVYWQDLVFAMNAFADGELPLWNPFMAMGYSFASEPQTGLFSPLNWFLYGVGLLSGSRGAWLIQAKVLLTFWIGLVGMHCWTHRRTGSHLAGVLGAITFGLGAPLLVFKNSALAWPVLYLPWALCTLESFVSRPSLRRGALLAGAVWLAGSAGSPQGFFFCGLVLAAYWAALSLRALWRPLGSRPPAADGTAPRHPAPCPVSRWGLRPRLAGLGRALRRQAPGLAAAAALSALLLAPVYVPARLAMDETPRAVRSLAFLLAQPQTWDGLWEWLLAHRDQNWFLDLYSGAMAAVLGAFALLTASCRSAPRRLFWGALFAGGMLLALGANTPVLPWLIRHVPGFDLFRIPYRYKLVAIVGLVALGTEGFVALLRGQTARWHRVLWVLLAAAWIVLALAAARGQVTSGAPPARAAAAQHLRYAGGALAALTAIALWPGGWRARLRGRVVPTLAVVALGLGLADLWSAGADKIRILERPPRHAPDRRLYARLPGLLAHTHRLFQFPSHLSAANARVRELGGYTTFPMRVRRFDGVFRVARFDRAFLRHFNVRWVHARVPGHLGRRLHRFAWRRGFDLLELKRPAPLLAVYPGFVRVPAGGGIAALRRLRPQETLGCALLEPDAVTRLPAPVRARERLCTLALEEPVPQSHAGAQAGAGSRAVVAGRLLHYGRNRLVFRVDAPAGGIAVVNEPFFSGWRARLDGRAVPLVRANHLLRAVWVPPGSHRLELRYWPVGYGWLLGGFGLGLLALIALLWQRPVRWTWAAVARLRVRRRDRGAASG